LEHGLRKLAVEGKLTFSAFTYGNISKVVLNCKTQWSAKLYLGGKGHGYTLKFTAKITTSNSGEKR
jgi:hypothetical protein